jgi:hypothetical protein
VNFDTKQVTKKNIKKGFFFIRGDGWLSTIKRTLKKRILSLIQTIFVKIPDNAVLSGMMDPFGTSIKLRTEPAGKVQMLYPARKPNGLFSIDNFIFVVSKNIKKSFYKFLTPFPDNRSVSDNAEEIV